MQINIDLVPYDVEIDGCVATLKDAPIDLTIPDRHVTVIHHGPDAGETRFQYLFLGDEPFLVEQVGKDWRITRHGGPIALHHVTDVILNNFAAICTLGWEALKP